ncbi:MAG TPA: protein kinase [Polyangiaceae bacterium]
MPAPEDAEATPPEVIPAGTVVGGKYRVEQVIGVGGMGVVLLATHVQLREKVALKLLRRVVTHPGSFERFVREARVSSRIRSEHVARVFDLGTLADGRPYIAMEFLEGVDLATVVARGGEIRREDAVDYVLQAAQGVAEAHALGVIHRDLKPANLFLTQRSDGSPLVKVLDFGISKIAHAGSLDGELLTTTEENPTGAGAPVAFADTQPWSGPAISGALTQTRATLGSPRYMAPEQFRSSRDVDARADVWALGTILYELLAGQPAFDAATHEALREVILNGEPAPLPASRKGVTPALRAVLARCLAKKPGARFRDLAELAAALAPLAEEGEAAAARVGRILEHAGGGAVSGRSTTGKPPPRKRRGAWWAAGAAIAVVASGVAWSRVHSSHAVATGKAQGERTTATPDAAPIEALDAAPRAPVSVRPSVALFPLRDLSARPETAWLGPAAVEMLATVLAAEDLRVASPDRASRIARDLAREHLEPSDPAVLGRVRQALGANFVVEGTYAALGAGRVRVDLELLDASTGEVRGRAGETGDAARLFELTETLGKALAPLLGAHEATPERLTQARAKSPESQEALRLLAEGKLADAKGRFADAVSLLKRAVDLAPASPIAHARLAMALMKAGRDLDERGEAAKAYEARTSLSREDQLRIQASYQEANKDWSASAETLRILYEFFPDNVEHGCNYARALCNAGRPKEAFPVLEALRSLPPPASGDLCIDVGESAAYGRMGETKKREAVARAAVAKADALGFSSQQSEAHMQLAQSLYGGGDLDGAKAETLRAKEIANAAQDEATEAGTVAELALIANAQGKIAEAIAMYDEALGHARSLGDLYRVAGNLNGRAIAEYGLGDIPAAQRDWEASNAEYREIRDLEGQGHTLGNLGNAYADLGLLAKAHDAHVHALALLRQIGMQGGIAEEQANLVDLACVRGDLKEADERQAEVDAVLPSLGRKIMDGIGRQLHAESARQRDRLDEARGELETALAVYKEMGADQMAADVKTMNAEIAISQGDAPRAERLATEAGDFYRQNGIVRSEPLADSALVRALSAQGRLAEAQPVLARLPEAGSSKLPVVSRFEVVRTRAVALAGSAEGDAALAALGDAIAQAKKMGFVTEELDLRLTQLRLTPTAAAQKALVAEATSGNAPRVGREAAAVALP